MDIISLCTIMVLAAFFLQMAVGKMITVSGKWWKRLLMLFSCWILLGTIIYIGDATNIIWAISFFLVVIQIVCEGGFWKKIVIGLMFSSTVFAFNALRDNYILTVHVRYVEPVRATIVSSCCALLFTLLLHTGIRRFAPDREYSLSESMWKLLLLLTMTPCGVVLSVIVLHPLSDTHGFDYILILIIALLSIIGLLWTVMVLAKQQKLEEQNMLAEINRSYYESMEEQHFAIRRLKHDLTNHLTTLTVMPEEQREAYIRSLIEDSPVTRSMQYCGDATVNAVLSVKEEQMEHYGIRLEAKIDIPKELPFEKRDICALFANALDNAAEACRKLEEDRRKILLRSKAQKGLFCLEVTNPVESAARESDDGAVSGIRKEEGLPQTSKPDKENHGIGLRSMKEIVERYCGAMELKAEGEVFEVFLYMPLR